MQFIAQTSLSPIEDLPQQLRDSYVLIFQCQNDPGMCDDWDANAGGNLACLARGQLSQVEDTPTGPVQLDDESLVEFRLYDDSVAEETPDDTYCACFDRDSEVLGKIGGKPLWIQGDETPSCDCGQAMRFVVQLEDRGGGGINFGDSGAGYAFVCVSCGNKAKFLWQCG